MRIADFEQYIDSNSGEYSINDVMKEVILNGFKGINNMSEEEQKEEQRRLAIIYTVQDYKYIIKNRRDKSYSWTASLSEEEFQNHLENTLIRGLKMTNEYSAPDTPLTMEELKDYIAKNNIS